MLVIQIAEGIFSFTCLALSLGCWILLMNLSRIKSQLALFETKISILQTDLPDWKHKLKSLSVKNFLVQNVLSPYAMIKLIEVLMLHRTGKLTKLLFVKTLFK
jgi:hypothetical protein